MRMATLTSNFKELSASIEFVLVFFNKGSLFRTMRGFESQSAQVSAHVACLMFDLFILCLVQEHWALLYFILLLTALHWIKVYEFFCLYCIVFPNICKNMTHTAGHCYWCTNIVSQNWNKLYLQLLHFFCTSISPLKNFVDFIHWLRPS